MAHATHTKQFQMKDIRFWKNGQILPHDSPLNLLVTGDSCIMKISNKKNGHTGQTLYQESTGLTGAVASVAQQVHHFFFSMVVAAANISFVMYALTPYGTPSKALR